MARAELRDSWIVSDDIDNIEASLRKQLNRQRMRIVEEAEGEIHFWQGSLLLTRLLGGWFVPAAWLPKIGTLTVKETKAGSVRICASIEEAIGFGYFDPLLKSKYEQFFQRWMDELRSGFE